MHKINKIIFTSVTLIAVFTFIFLIKNTEEITEKIPSIISYSHHTTVDKPEQFLQVANASESDKKESTEVTVYNKNLALVKEDRIIQLEKGYNEVKYIDIPSQINAKSVLFTDVHDPETQVVEQSYEYDLVSTKKMLEKYIDKEITINATEGDSSNSYTGKLLSYTDGVLLETNDGVVQLKNIEKISFKKLEDGLLTKPTLVWTIWTDQAGEHQTKTSYLTGGMTWQADYVAEVNADDDQINLDGWTTVNNNSGTSFPQAQLKLVAGDVNTVSTASRMMKSNYLREDMEMDSVAEEAGFSEESLFEYHMYTLGRKTDLKSNSSKQISLLKGSDIPVEKEFIFDDNKDSKVRTVLNFKNAEDQGLGIPLPKGTLRVYKADAGGQLQFIGEDSIDHTPKDEDLQVFLGNAFDLTAEKKTMNTTRNGKILDYGKSCEEKEKEVTLKNHKTEDVTITVVENTYGTDTNILEESIPFEKEDEYTYKFKVAVPKDGEVKLTYTVKRCW